MDATIKKIPYGMTNFESIICDNYYYVDKTHYITKVENTSRFFFLSVRAVSVRAFFKHA